MLPSNVILCYQLNVSKLNEYQFNTASSLIQWIGKTQCQQQCLFQKLVYHLLSWKITKYHFFTTIVSFRGFQCRKTLSGK